MVEDDSSSLDSVLGSLDCSKYIHSLPGREKHIKRLKGELQRCIKTKYGPGHVFYIYGQPGTGKTATVRYVLRDLLKTVRSVKAHEINCLALKSTSAIYTSLSTAILGAGSKRSTLSAARLELSSFFHKGQSSRTHHIIIFDEFENLFNMRDKALDYKLYEIFDWTHKKNANLTIICIANGIYLYQNGFSQRTHSRVGNASISFPSYKWDELLQLLQARVPNLHDFFEEAALEMLCRKTSSRTGDVRSILSIAKNLLENVYAKRKRLITLDDCLEAVASTFNNSTIVAIKSIGVHSRILLGCCLCVICIESLLATCSQVYQKFKYELTGNYSGNDPITRDLFQASLNELIENRMIRYIHYLSVEMKSIVSSTPIRTPSNRNTPVRSSGRSPARTPTRTPTRTPAQSNLLSSELIHHPWGQWAIVIDIPVSDIIEALISSDSSFSKLSLQVQSRFGEETPSTTLAI